MKLWLPHIIWCSIVIFILVGMWGSKAEAEATGWGGLI